MGVFGHPSSPPSFHLHGSSEGINCVELLPVYEFDETACPRWSPGLLRLSTSVLSAVLRLSSAGHLSQLFGETACRDEVLWIMSSGCRGLIVYRQESHEW